MTDPNTFDETTDRSAGKDDHDVDGDHARKAAPLGEGKHDHLTEKTDAEDRQEALVDEGVEETFPASDPVSAKRIT
ncbi:hypothetical protein [Brevundimonas aurifodinae]|uniref:Uncharacterized protein n=2 Tax=Brevundimonas TaxID=41275 RepID=A0ABV1NSC2_9CAUL|nr:MAG: hypothetical protein B7Z42_11635 [Brevundimonas sp. 12-68-7]OYX30789.1 MAG: hypothetical protein B7Z01_13850 [Brevundimonas subvibrioides]